MKGWTQRLCIFVVLTWAVPSVAAPIEEAVQTGPGRDPHGDPLPAGALQRLGTVRFRPQTSALLLAYTTDGRALAMIDGGFLRFMDVATGQELRRIATVAGVAQALSADGRFLATGNQQSAQRLRVWDVSTGQELPPFEGHTDWVRGVSFSADGKVLASGSNDKSVRLWSVPAGKEIKCFAGEHLRGLLAVALSPDGKTLAVSCNAANARYRVCLLDAATGKQLRETLVQAPVFKVAFSADGKSLLAVEPINGGKDNSTIHLWEVAEWKHRPLPGQPERVSFARFSPNGQLLATGSEHKTCVWDAATGKLLCTLGEYGPSSSLAFSPDGKTLAASNARAIRFFDTATGEDRTPRLAGHQQEVVAIAYQPDGRTLATAGRDQTLRLWDAKTGKEARPILKLEHAEYPEYRFAPDGKTLAWCVHKKHVSLLDVAAGKTRRVPAPGTSLAFSDDAGSLAIGGMRNGKQDQPLQIWDLATGKARITFSQHRYYDCMLALAPNGKYLVSLRDEGEDSLMELALWDVVRGRKVRHWPDQEDWADFLFSPDSRLLAFHVGGKLSLWDLAADKERFSFALPIGTRVLAFSRSGALLAVGSDSKVLIYDVARGRELASFAGHRSGITALAFALDDLVLASASYDTTVLLWNLADVQRRRLPPENPLTREELDGLWADLASSDGPRTHRAVWSLAAAPGQSARFLKDRLQPPRPVEAARLDRLIKDLDADGFAERERAYEELEKLGDVTLSGLRKALAANPAAETKRRLERLLDKLTGDGSLPAHLLRSLRAVEVLEHLASDAARAQLEELAASQPATRVSQEADAALKRLKRR